jgi:septum site-determining protein MinD
MPENYTEDNISNASEDENRYDDNYGDPPLDTKGSKTRVIGIVSGKGGVGKTTFAANLSIALTALEQKVVVIDCNVTTPHLSYYLGVKNFSSTINNVFAGDLDAIFAPLDQNGVLFIPASEHFVDLKKVDMKDLKKIISRLVEKGDFDFIILDSAPGLGREAMGVMNACNEIIFLTNPTAPNVMDVARCNEVARMIGHKKFSMVMNMVRGKDYELKPEKAEELFGMPVLGMIPFDENILDSTAEGVPIMWYKPKSPSCSNFLSIAAQLAGLTEPTVPGREGGEEGEGEGIGPFGRAEESEEPEEEKVEGEEREEEAAGELPGRRGRIIPIIKRSIWKGRRKSHDRHAKGRKERERKDRAKIKVKIDIGKVAKKIRGIFSR